MTPLPRPDLAARDVCAQLTSMAHTSHRPWPLPRAPWVMGQTWKRLAFLHWKVPAAGLAALLPDGLELDTYRGGAFLGITPFELGGLALPPLPPPPFVSSFVEVNVRTYVVADGRPGIWFFDLSATSRLAVAGGRRMYRLPYRHCEAEVRENAARAVHYAARRRDAPAGVLDVTVHRLKDDFSTPRRGTLEHFLSERYRLYTYDQGRLLAADIHHRPWKVSAARATVHEASLSNVALPVTGQPDHVMLASDQDVLVWPLKPIRA